MDFSFKSEIKTIQDLIDKLEIEISGKDVDIINELVEKLNHATQRFSEKRVKKSLKSGLVLLPTSLTSSFELLNTISL